MEIIARYQSLQKALQTLEEILTILEKLDIYNNVMQAALRDSTIQRFEYSIDTFWKFLKIYFEQVKLMDIAVPSSREIIRIGVDFGLINQEEYKIIMKCISDHNLTSHTYNEELAKEIVQRIPIYFITMKQIVDRIQIND